MPTYDYVCTKCADETTHISTIADRMQPCASPCEVCGGVIRLKLGTALISDNIKLGLKKPPSGFNEMLRIIKKSNKGSNINIRD